MRRIVTIDDVAEGLEALVKLDPRLSRVRDVAGDLPLRLTEPGLVSLASIVMSQQVSRASADAIFGRLVSLLDPFTPVNILAAPDELFRAAGLSRPKQKTLIAIAHAVDGGLDLHQLVELDASDAMTSLTSVPGVGPWTAEVYLLFAAGHPDIFPAKDVALQSAVGHAFGIQPRPGDRALAVLAQSWSPWRGIASRLFWAYYLQMRGRDGAPAAIPDENPKSPEI